MGLEDEYSGGIRKAKKSGLRPFLPVLGLFLAVALAAVAYVIGPTVAQFAGNQFGFEVTMEVEWVVRGVVFLVLLGFAAMIYAAATPKQKTHKLATEKQLKKEKEMKRQEVIAKKKRQQAIQKRMAEERRRNQGR